jgi:hypothetical protein
MDSCTRCGGLLTTEHLAPCDEDGITLIKCLNCGDRTDPLIAFHRLLTGTAPKEHEPMRIAS